MGPKVMIHGIVSDELEAVISIELLGLTTINVEAVIDTGFTDYLTLPIALIQSLSFVFVSSEEVILADGSQEELDCYYGKLEWDGAVRETYVLCSESTPLIGMLMLEGYELRMKVVSGGAVTIEKTTNGGD
jgi:clan AA aspartic protease